MTLHKTLLAMMAALTLTACNPLGSDDDDDGGSGGGGGGGSSTACDLDSGGTYNACVRRTKFGIPHIKGNNFGSLGYGYGYAFAEDNLCVLMNDLVTIRGERARYFGPDGNHVIIPNGSVANNVDSDFFWKFINEPAPGETQPPWQKLKASAVKDLQDVTTGFVAGFNRYIGEIKAGQHAGRHASCRGEPWLQPIEEADMYRRYYRLALIASSSVFVSGIANAQPPALAAPSGSGGGGGGGGTLCAPGSFPIIGGQCSPVDPTASAAGRTRKAPSKATMIAALKQDPGPLAAFQQANKDKFGSNMYAFSKDATESGVPMVFGNPHFPWSDTERLYIAHATIHGKLDIMGSSLYGVPAILIGFNRHFAWSHTVSTAYRFTLYELTLNPANPTQYLYDGALRDMTPYEIEVEVKGETAKRKRTLYRSHYGPIMGLSTRTPAGPVNILPWTNLKAYTLRDANAENDRLINQFAKWNQATSLDEFIGLHKSVLGIPWVNTVASGPGGKAYYGDVSVVPNVTDEQIQTCRAIPLHDVIQQVAAGLPVLDGSRSACEWGTDDDAPAPGIFGPGKLPTLVRDDWVHNCNDSYWLTNPKQPIEGYDRIIGAERTERSLRTRLCILHAQRHLGEASTPAGAPNFDADGDQKFDLKELQDTVLSSHILSSELARATLLSTVCQSPQVLTESGPVDISAACTVLAAWNQSGNLDARGAHIWREFWRRAAPNLAGVGPNPLLWQTPFSAADPVNTPRDLNPLNLLQLQRAFGNAVKAVQDAGFALDAPMQDIQKSGVHTVSGKPDVSVPGGEGHEGAFTIVSTGPLRDTGYRVTYGNSYIQTVTWTSNQSCTDKFSNAPGCPLPVAEGFVTYAQSTDPASPHFRDYTEAYSKKEWHRFPFTEDEITAAGVLSTKSLKE
jgi:acyl-homoserine-lactone acylase